MKLRGKIGTEFLFNTEKESLRKTADDHFKQNMQEMQTFS